MRLLFGGVGCGVGVVVVVGGGEGVWGLTRINCGCVGTIVATRTNYVCTGRTTLAQTVYAGTILAQMVGVNNTSTNYVVFFFFFFWGGGEGGEMLAQISQFAHPIWFLELFSWLCLIKKLVWHHLILYEGTATTFSTYIFYLNTF